MPYIDRYWGRESTYPGDTILPEVLPGTGMEILFHSSRPFYYREGAVNSLAGPAHIVCVRKRTYSLNTDRKLQFIAIRFKAGMFRYFSSYPFKEIADSFTPVSHIWGAEGNELAEKIVSAPTIQKKVSLLNTYLPRFLKGGTSSKNRIDYGVQSLYYSYRDIKLDTLYEELNLSRRHFNRLFTEAMGISPKYFHRVARFEQTIKKLLLNYKTVYLDTILDAGYYDQAHFIKECKIFTGTTPGAFLRKRNFMSHFYNTTLY